MQTLPILKFFVKNFLIVLTAVILLVFFNNYWSGQFLKSSVLSVFKKPLVISSSFLNKTKRRVVSWFSTGELLRQNKTLKEENRQLASVNLKIYELEKENDFLRKELGVVQRKNFKVSLARVFQQFDGQFQTSLIDIGDNEGIKPGMPVIFDGEVLYGVVKEVYPTSAMVYLITDPRVALSVKIKDSEIMGRSRGELKDGLSLELVANQEDVQAGETVMTSGLDGLPSALLVGKIMTVKEDRGGIFKEIKIEPEFKSLLVDRVFVLKLL